MTGLKIQQINNLHNTITFLLSQQYQKIVKTFYQNQKANRKNLRLILRLTILIKTLKCSKKGKIFPSILNTKTITKVLHRGHSERLLLWVTKGLKSFTNKPRKNPYKKDKISQPLTINIKNTKTNWLSSLKSSSKEKNNQHKKFITIIYHPESCSMNKKPSIGSFVEEYKNKLSKWPLTEESLTIKRPFKNWENKSFSKSSKNIKSHE